EQQEEGLSFVRVDSDPDSLKSGDGEEDAVLKDLFAPLLGETEISFVRLKDEHTPALFVTEENARRFSDIYRAFSARTGEEMPAIPRGERFCVNLAASVFSKVKVLGKEEREVYARQIYYGALIAARELTKDELSAFLENNNRLLDL
ncbi:MAG: hypothetical protein IKT43_00195, partial [Clostridia bacterium]|nr:hypothetical protein [Clostridia bacterium]